MTEILLKFVLGFCTGLFLCYSVRLLTLFFLEIKNVSKITPEEIEDVYEDEEDDPGSNDTEVSSAD